MQQLVLHITLHMYPIISVCSWAHLVRDIGQADQCQSPARLIVQC